MGEFEMRQAVKAVSTVAWGFPPGFVAGRLTEDAEREPAAGVFAAPMGSGLLVGQITKVTSTREGRLVLMLGTEDGEVALHSTSWMRVFHGDDTLPLGDLWHHVGSEAVVAWIPDGCVRVIDSVTIQ